MLEIRILEVFTYSKLTRQEFATRIGISNAVMSHISSGRNKASTDLIVSILKNFEDISPEWLLFGNGDMLKSQKGKSMGILKEDLFNRINQIKLIQNELNQSIITLETFINELGN